MSQFMRVLADDPQYEGKKTYMYIAAHSIAKVVPVFAIKGDNGILWICHQDDEGAVHVSNLLFDSSGRQYSCGDKSELCKLGIDASENREIGFLQSDAEKTAFDIDTEV